MKRTMLALFAALSLLSTSAVQAAIYHFEVDLLGANEAPPAASPGFGSAKIDVDTDALTMTLDVVFADLLGITTASHIHCCNTTPTSPVATQVPSFIGFPLGVSSGSYFNVFDMDVASSYNPTFITNNGGTVDSAFAALVAGMLGGRAYLNIHSNLFPAGEIRGTLIQVPEPASLALFGIALAGLGVLRRRSAAR